MKHLIACALLAPTLALAQAPLEFKGVPFGSEPAALRELAMATAQSFLCDFPDDEARLCQIGGMTYANAPTKRIFASYVNKRLEHIKIEASPDAFAATVRALTERYGKPAKTTKSKVRTKMGATFDQVEHAWSTADGGVITAKLYGDDIDTSHVSMTSGAAIRREFVESAARPKKKDI